MRSKQSRVHALTIWGILIDFISIESHHCLCMAGKGNKGILHKHEGGL